MPEHGDVLQDARLGCYGTPSGADVTQPVDNSILHEIVRVIESRRKVPEKVIVKSKEYVLTYLEDHRRRLEEALQRYDADRLNMLYGQLASKIKYQLLRRLPARAAAAVGMKAGRAAASKAPAAKKGPAKRASKPKRGAVKPSKAATAKRKPAGRRVPSKVRKAAAKTVKKAAVKKVKKAAAKKRK